jgi:hypothetical protein
VAGIQKAWPLLFAAAGPALLAIDMSPVHIG